eukprot:3072854-Amphidinium_carterae.1
MHHAWYKSGPELAPTPLHRPLPNQSGDRGSAQQGRSPLSENGHTQQGPKCRGACMQRSGQPHCSACGTDGSSVLGTLQESRL